MGWVLGILAALGVATVLLFNDLVRARVAVRRAWAQVDTQLQRRHDLIPGLVAVVRAAAAHERAALDAVVRARAQALAVDDPVQRQLAEDDLGATVGRLVALAEENPTLATDDNFRALQLELAATEDRLAFARGFANDRVARYRRRTDTFPGLLVARALRFPRAALFALEDERARPVAVIELGEAG